MGGMGADVVGVPMSPTLSAVGVVGVDVVDVVDGGWLSWRWVGRGAGQGRGSFRRGVIAISDGGAIVMGVGSVGGPRV